MMHTPDIAPRLVRLTARQMDAVRLICLPQKAAAHRLGITVGAYKLRLRNAADAVGAMNSWELTAVAARSGVLLETGQGAANAILATGA